MEKNKGLVGICVKLFAAGAICALLVVAIVAAQNAPARKPAQLPPAGVPVPAADQKELRAGLDKLGVKMESLKGNPLLPDVVIFHKAVRYAFRGGMNSTRKNRFSGPRNCFARGWNARDALARGDAPWTRATGLVVRGYTSKIDGSVQPYGLVGSGIVLAYLRPFLAGGWLVSRAQRGA